MDQERHIRDIILTAFKLTMKMGAVRKQRSLDPQSFHKESGMDQEQQIRDIIHTAAFAALIAAGSVLVIPLGPVPVTLQTMLIAVTGLLLGPKKALLACLLYLLAGTLGLPVFAGGKAGLGVLAGPTGGYLLGFIPMVWLCGAAGRQKTLWLTAALMLLGLAAAHACGIAMLCATLKRSLAQAFAIDAVFIPGDIIKTFAAIVIWRSYRKMMRHD